MSEVRSFSLGLDIGQRIDHSALCLTEVFPDRAIVRLLVKYPLGTGFPEVVQTVTELYQSVKLKGEVQWFVVDATGVGAEPSRMLQKRIPDARVEGFIFTNKSKRELVGKVRVMHSYGQLRFATKKGDETYNRTLSELITEMKNLQLKVIKGDDDNPEIEVFKTGAHDDLFTAVALSVKNLDFGRDNPGALFVEDKSWSNNPLTEDLRPAPEILFF